MSDVFTETACRCAQLIVNLANDFNISIIGFFSLDENSLFPVDFGVFCEDNTKGKNAKRYNFTNKLYALIQKNGQTEISYQKFFPEELISCLDKDTLDQEEVEKIEKMAEENPPQNFFSDSSGTNSTEEALNKTGLFSHNTT